MTVLLIAILVTVLWILAVVLVAFLAHKNLGTSRNPAEWITFFFVGPVIVAMFFSVFAILTSVLLVGVMVTLILYPLRTVLSANHEGLIITRWIGTRRQIVHWAEIEEVIETEDFPFPSACAVLKGGQRINLPPLDSSICASLTSNGVCIRLIPFNEAGGDEKS